MKSFYTMEKLLNKGVLHQLYWWVPTGVISYPFKTALIKLFDMPSEVSSPENHDFVHHHPHRHT